MGYRQDPKSGLWLAWYSKRDPITRQPISLRRKNIKSKAEAKRVEKELVIKVEEKIKSVATPTWAKLLTEFEKSMEQNGLTDKTINTYMLCLNAHTLTSWEKRLVDDITGDEIRQLIKDKVGHRSTSHQKNMLKFIRAAFKFALEKGYILRNPTPTMKFRVGDKIKNVLTEPQVATLLNQAKIMENEWYPIWSTALYTGMRNGELYALTWDNVKLDERQIFVKWSWNNKDGYKETKSGDDRVVEIAPNLLTIFRELKLQSGDSNFVLPRIDKWDRGEQARELRMFLMGLGLPTVRFHDLRATWATIMLSKGIPPIKVMIMGGWKDLKTMQVYIRKSGVNLRGTTDQLNLHSCKVNSNDLLQLRVK